MIEDEGTAAAWRPSNPTMFAILAPHGHPPAKPAATQNLLICMGGGRVESWGGGGENRGCPRPNPHLLDSPQHPKYWSHGHEPKYGPRLRRLARREGATPTAQPPPKPNYNDRHHMRVGLPMTPALTTERGA